MTEEKPKSWAPITEDPSIQEPEEELTAEQEENIRNLQMSIEIAPLKMVDLLERILLELQMANTEAFGRTATPPLETKVVESSPSPQHPQRSYGIPVEEKPDLTKPSNVAGEDEIIAHYNSQFSGLTANNGEELTDETIGKFTYSFTEDTIILKTGGFMPTPVWATLAGKIKELGGEYVRGKGAHFVLPYP